MKKLMLIAGCSHTSGSEINGEEDAPYNRQKSYGNQLAEIMGYTAINIAEPGSSNPTIARSILQWFSEKYNPNEMEVFVVVGWTESTRMEIPWHRPTWYAAHCPYGDFAATTGTYYLRVNSGWPGSDPEEKVVVPEYQKFMANNEKYLEILSANSVLQIQYFLKSKNVNYVMCNTMHVFYPRDTHTSFYMEQMDLTKYYHMENSSQSFYPKYRELGFVNNKAKYWHHNEGPHRLYAEELYDFIRVNNVHN